MTNLGLGLFSGALLFLSLFGNLFVYVEAVTREERPDARRAYFVLNASEVIATIRETIPCTRIVLLKDYQPLGGHNDRYLPKDCYEPATGTALTVVGVWRAQMGSPNPEIIIEEDRHVNPRLTIFDRKPSYIFKKVISKVLRPNR